MVISAIVCDTIEKDIIMEPRCLSMSTLYVARCCDSLSESRAVRPRLQLPVVGDTSATRPSSQRRQLAPEVSRRPTVSVSTSARPVPVGTGRLRQPPDRRPHCERRLGTRLPSRYSTAMETNKQTRCCE